MPKAEFQTTVDGYFLKLLNIVGLCCTLSGVVYFYFHFILILNSYTMETHLNKAKKVNTYCCVGQLIYN